MLRMSQLLPVFRHGRTGMLCVVSLLQRRRRARHLALRRRVGGQDYSVGTGGAGGAGTGGATAAGFIADVIIGITTPLSRSIAWPAPSCCAALLRSLSRPPPPPVLAAAGIAEP